MNDGFYRAFEERFRGSRELIKERLSAYLPFVEPLLVAYPGVAAIDLGCGRGEWLELLVAAGLNPTGIDLDQGMLNACQELSLPVEHGDALAYLRALPDESQAVVSAFHLVEHITFDQLRILVSEALRVLKLGGLLIMETPNPENIVVATRNFYLDPTHQRPIPSMLLAFVAEYAGFVRVLTLRLQESKAMLDKNDVCLRDVFVAVSPDYAVVAQKDASSDILSLSDHLFSLGYGVSLDQLLSRWDCRFERLECRARQVSLQSDQSKTTAQQGIAQAAEAQTNSQRAIEQAMQAEVKAQQAIAQAAEAQSNSQRAIEQAVQAEIKAQQALLEATLPRLLKRALKGIVRRLKMPLTSIPMLGEPSAKRSSLQSPLHRIWVDLTPMLPGGANGGAKPFILCLLAQLADLHPTVLFNCTCSLEMVEELLPLRSSNVKFTNESPLYGLAPGFGSRWLGKAMHHWMWRLRLKSEATRESGANDAQLLFCPFGAPLLYQPGLPTVSTFYDLQVNAYPEFFTAKVRQERLRHFRHMLAKASRIAAISHFSRDQAIGQGADPSRIKAIPLRMPFSRRRSHSKIPILELLTGQYFLYPANLWLHKNHELLLTAFAMARHQGLPAALKLVCTGDGADRLISLRALAKDLGLGETVILPGFVSDEDLESLYQHSLAVVFPSLYEGFGLPIIEAMARGLPVACSATTALAEVAGDAALFFHPGNPQQIADALRQLAEDSSLRQHLCALGIRQAESYANPAVMANQYWELFQEAFAEGRHS